MYCQIIFREHGNSWLDCWDQVHYLYLPLIRQNISRARGYRRLIANNRKQFTIVNWRNDPHTYWTISAIVSPVHLKFFRCLQRDSNPCAHIVVSSLLPCYSSQTRRKDRNFSISCVMFAIIDDWSGGKEELFPFTPTGCDCLQRSMH